MLRLFPILFLPLLSQTLHADSMLLGDAKQGEALHNKSCVACHTSSVYTRPDRTVKTIGGLVGRVNGCNAQLSLDLPKDKIDDLVKYLNDRYYKFE